MPEHSKLQKVRGIPAYMFNRLAYSDAVDYLAWGSAGLSQRTSVLS